MKYDYIVIGGGVIGMRPWDENIDSHKLSEESKKNYSEFIFKLQEESGINVEFIKSGLIIMNEEHSEKTKKMGN